MKIKKLLGIALGAVAFTLASCGSKELTVAAPNGAPAIALASVAGVKGEDNNYTLASNYELVDAEAIASVLTKGEKDLVIAPVNAGAKLYKAGKSKYKLAAVVTWGNLAFASQKENFTIQDITKDNLILFGKESINASIADYVLKANNINITNSKEEYNYKVTAADTRDELLKNPDAIVLSAEPAITAAKLQKSNITSIDVQALYKEATGKSGYTQAGLFVNPNSNTEKVNELINKIKTSALDTKNDLDKVAKISVDLKILPKEAVAKKAIPLCNINFVKAIDAKSEIEANAQIDMTQFGGALPADDFYYSEF